MFNRIRWAKNSTATPLFYICCCSALITMKLIFKSSNGEIFFLGQKAWFFMKDGVKNSLDIGYIRVTKKNMAKYDQVYKYQSRLYKSRTECLQHNVEYTMNL